MRDDPNEMYINPLPTARRGERPDRPKAIAEMAAEKILTDLMRQVPQVVDALTGQFEGTHTEVSKEEYAAVRAQGVDDVSDPLSWQGANPAHLKLWEKQVGPSAWFDEFFEITKPPKEWEQAYREAVKIGMGNVEAIRYADATTLPPPPMPYPVTPEPMGLLDDVQPGEPMLGQPEPLEQVNPMEMAPQPGESMLGAPAPMPMPQAMPMVPGMPAPPPGPMPGLVPMGPPPGLMGG